MHATLGASIKKCRSKAGRVLQLQGMAEIKGVRAGVTNGIRLDKVKKKEKLFMHAEKFKLDMMLNGSHLHSALVQVIRQRPPSPLLKELSSGRILLSGPFHKS